MRMRHKTSSTCTVITNPNVLGFYWKIPLNGLFFLNSCVNPAVALLLSPRLSEAGRNGSTASTSGSIQPPPPLVPTTTAEETLEQATLGKEEDGRRQNQTSTSNNPVKSQGIAKEFVIFIRESYKVALKKFIFGQLTGMRNFRFCWVTPNLVDSSLRPTTATRDCFLAPETSTGPKTSGSYRSN